MEIDRRHVIGIALFVVTLLVVGFIFGEVALIFDPLSSAAIGPDYCFQLTSHKPDVARDAAAASHFCEFNMTTGELEFNKTAFLAALSHVET
jgi:hypothetical protein